MKMAALPRLGLLALLTLAMTEAVTVDWQWRTGARASWYGNGDWPLDIGGCNYGYLWPNEGTGLDVAALPDVHREYVDSCGTCYEISCDNTWTSDNYGASYDRRSACYDTSASVVVRIVDTCPCTYPANAWSNKRWCCGDRDTFDMSMWAFEKLAELRWGVIPIKYRPVPCWYKPQNPAKPLAHPSPPIPLNPPAGAQRVTRDWPELRSSSIQTRIIFEDSGLENGFYDASWNAWVSPLNSTRNKGMLGGPGICATVRNGGAMSFKAWNGVFQNAVALEFWTYVGYPGYDGSANKVPDITISISGNKGGCSPVRIMHLKPMMFQPECIPYCSDYWWGYRVYLPVFGGAAPNTVINNPASFQGCGNNGVWDLNRIEFRHDGYGGTGDKWMCLDHIQLS